MLEQAKAFSDTFQLADIWRDAVDEPGDSPFAPSAPWKNRGHLPYGGENKEDEAGAEEEEECSHCVRASPEKDLTIGFFVACFKRRKGRKSDAKRARRE